MTCKYHQRNLHSRFQLIFCNSEPERAYENINDAEEYRDAEFDRAVDEARRELGMDDDDLDERGEAAFQAGYDNGIYEIVPCDVPEKDDDEPEDDFELPDGTTISWYDIDNAIKNS